MKKGLMLGIFFALILHGGIILFGGFLFLDSSNDYGTLQKVELLSESDAVTDDEKEKEKPDEKETENAEELETDVEQAPDAAEIVRNLELSAANDAPNWKPPA